MDVVGFDDGTFTSTTSGSRFTAFGGKHGSYADRYALETRTQEHVLLFEDKVGRLPTGGYCGQVFGEMLMMVSLNTVGREKGNLPLTCAPRKVYGIRLTGFRVTIFSMQPTIQQAEDVLLRDKAPTSLITVLHTGAGLNDPGWSLIDKKERQRALRCISTIRGSITQRGSGVAA